MNANGSSRAFFEDAEQASVLRWPSVKFFFDRFGVVLKGPHRGEDIGAATQEVMSGHLQGGRDVSWTLSLARPWWRLWQATQTITVTVHVLEFQGGEP